MKTNKNNTKKKDNTMFAFLPETVIEHINDPELKEFKTESQNPIKEESIDETQPIVFDPLADPFDGLDIEMESSKKNKEKKSQNKIF